MVIPFDVIFKPELTCNDLIVNITLKISFFSCQIQKFLYLIKGKLDLQYQTN